MHFVLKQKNCRSVLRHVLRPDFVVILQLMTRKTGHENSFKIKLPLLNKIGIFQKIFREGKKLLCNLNNDMKMHEIFEKKRNFPYA